MALATYDDLKAALSDWLIGHALADRSVDFIAMAEADLNRKLRTRQQQRRSTTEPDGAYVALPLDFAEAVNVTLNESSRQIQQVTFAFADLVRKTETGSPAYFVISGQQMEILPTPQPGDTVEMVYYATIPPLRDTEPSNWLLKRAPDLYLYAALAQAGPYINDENRAALWEKRRDQIITDLNQEAEAAAYSASPLVMRTGSFG